MAPRYKYGYEVPRNYNHAVELDKRNGNTKWQDSTALEMSQLHEYKTNSYMNLIFIADPSNIPVVSQYPVLAQYTPRGMGKSFFSHFIRFSWIFQLC